MPSEQTSQFAAAHGPISSKFCELLHAKRQRIATRHGLVRRGALRLPRLKIRLSTARIESVDRVTD
jgi:hypothetical protein